MSTVPSARRPSHAALFLLLRVGVALCFIGHGAFGLLRKEAWLVYMGLFGIGGDTAHWLMPLVGLVDIGVGLLALAFPAPGIFLYAAGWALFTAALRPLAGEGVWELLERAGNYGVPVMAFGLARVADGRGGPHLLRPARPGPAPLNGNQQSALLLAARWTTALLLAGHGALAVQGKPLLVDHAAAIGGGVLLVRSVGLLELAAAVAVLRAVRPSFFLGVAGWKLATESLFLVAGAPAWEWVERGGSYVAPLVAAWLLAAAPSRLAAGNRAAGHAPRRRAGHLAAPRPMLLVLALPVMATLATTIAAVPVAAQEPTPRVDAPLLERLRTGGLILACRHGLTDPDARPAADPLETRPLTADGEAQARRLGELIRALRIPVGDVLTSGYARTRRTAELAFGRAVVEEALWSSGRRQELRPRLFSEPPSRGNRVLMTHQGVLYRALPVPRRSIEEGDCVVLEGRGAAGFRVLGQASNADWQRLLETGDDRSPRP